MIDDDGDNEICNSFASSKARKIGGWTDQPPILRTLCGGYS